MGSIFHYPALNLVKDNFLFPLATLRQHILDNVIGILILDEVIYFPLKNFGYEPLPLAFINFHGETVLDKFGNFLTQAALKSIFLQHVQTPKICYRGLLAVLLVVLLY